MRTRNDISSDLTTRFDRVGYKNEQTRPYSYKNDNGVRKNNKGKRKNNKKSAYSKFFKRYVIILCVLISIFLGYVLNTLYQYEDSYTDNYMAGVVKNIEKLGKKGQISKICNVNLEKSELDTSNVSVNNAMKDLFKNSNITYKMNSGSKNSNNPVYSIYANDNKIMEVTLKVEKTKTRLGMFTYKIWNVDNYKLEMPRGLIYYDVYVPSNYTVEVNGNKVGENYISDKTANEDYDKFAEYINLPKMVNYELNNFVGMPSIRILDDKGVEIKTSAVNNKIQIENSSITAKNYEEAKEHIKGDIDIIKLAENWSLFLTDDLKGNQHGFSQLKPYLINGSNFYKMAYAWATSIDITFVSSHTFKNPAFTNESVSDFTIYSDSAFSCSVYLEKNMRIANGKDKVDVMHDKLYFVYYDSTNDGIDNPSWKLIDMKSIVDK